MENTSLGPLSGAGSFLYGQIKNHGTDTKTVELGNVHRNALLESFRNKVT
jgi:hypothetical protein